MPQWCSQHTRLRGSVVHAAGLGQAAPSVFVISVAASDLALAEGQPKVKARKLATPLAGAHAAADDGESLLLARLAAFECDDPLPMQLLRRFVAYAREHCQPVLTRGAKLVLKDFYLDLRKHSAVYRSTCITVRPSSHHDMISNR